VRAEDAHRASQLVAALEELATLEQALKDHDEIDDVEITLPAANIEISLDPQTARSLITPLRSIIREELLTIGVEL
jgi:hypothetical protein